MRTSGHSVTRSGSTGTPRTHNRRTRPHSWRTERRFGCGDHATCKQIRRRYRNLYDSWRASGAAGHDTDGDLVLPNEFYLALVRGLEVVVLPHGRYEVWRTANPNESYLGFVDFERLGLDEDRAQKLEAALFAIRPADEISKIEYHEIRKVLAAYGVYGQFQREDLACDQLSAAGAASNVVS